MSAYASICRKKTARHLETGAWENFGCNALQCAASGLFLPTEEILLHSNRVEVAA